MDYSTYNISVYNSQQPSHNMFSYLNHVPLNNISDKPECDTKNRYVYINQNFINANGPISTKVLINPNFKQTVHINPNFKNHTKHSIHVNPNLLKLTATKSVVTLNTKYDSKDKLNTDTVPKPIISTKTKLVRAATSENPHYKHERRKSLHSKYKIIHAKENISKSETNIRNNYFKNKYKIDKNILKVRKPLNQTYMKSKYSLQNVFSSISKKDMLLKEIKQRNSKYITINGTLYKKTPNVLRKADLVKMTSGESSLEKSKVLLRRGRLYKLDHRQKTLKVLPLAVNSSIQKCTKNIDSKISKHRKLNLSIKLIRTKRKLVLSNTKHFTKEVLINKMKKCNIPCLIYRKFGKCKARELGKCIRLHNPNQIMMCTKFLQGACIDSKCLLSHKVSIEKMPTCKYFLEGLCTKEDCVYLHVKINAKADICKDFLEGFCKKAKECDKRHQFLCPDYEKKGSCPRKRCRYPHGNMVRKPMFLNKVAKRIVKKRNSSSTAVKIKLTKVGNSDQVDKNVRYYTENSEGTENKNIAVVFEDNQDDKCDLTVSDSNNAKLAMSKRAQLGILPCFIPLGAETTNMRDKNI